MSRPSIIAIDGTAASGKSTVAARLAAWLGYLYFDTGVMYRAVTWAVLDRGLDPAGEAEVSRLAENLQIEVTSGGPPDGRQYTVLVDGRDATWSIRSPEVETHVSRVAGYPRVRAALTAQQRRIARVGSIVMVGRDIGTVVLPGADLKIFMRASPREQAYRRYNEALAQGQPVDFERTLAAIVERDKQDRNNPVSPMVPARDAIVVETDRRSVDDVLAQLEKLVQNYENGEH